MFGWGAFALFNIYIDYNTQKLTYKIFYIELLATFFGFIISHLYRNFILRRSWPLKDTEKLISHVLAATVLLSLSYNVVLYLLLLVVDVKPKDAFVDYLGEFIGGYILFAIWNLFYFAWQYIEKNRRILIDTLKMESALKDLEIKTIRSNLQPHFIFNSLNSIRALIDENPELARDAITKISNILRNTITRQEATDSLENEIALVEDYLALEKIRFEERLHFEKKIAPHSLFVQIPTMMLQTLIENAIKHGISNLQQGGNIILNTRMIEDEFLEIEIVNDINPVQVSVHENSLGFGISSTKQRLRLLYGDQAEMSLQFNESQATVLIKIPVQKEK